MGLVRGGLLATRRHGGEDRGDCEAESLHFLAERIGHPRRGGKPEFNGDVARRWMSRLVRLLVGLRYLSSLTLDLHGYGNCPGDP